MRSIIESYYPADNALLIQAITTTPCMPHACTSNGLHVTHQCMTCRYIPVHRARSIAGALHRFSMHDVWLCCIGLLMNVPTDIQPFLICLLPLVLMCYTATEFTECHCVLCITSLLVPVQLTVIKVKG